MKKNLTFSGLLACLLAFGLVFVSCDDGGISSPAGGDTAGSGNEQQAIVTGVSVNPLSAMVPAGQTQQFSAVVSGTNNPAQTVTWTVEGGGSGTSISTSGLLSVAANEAAPLLTVRATSTVDSSKSGTATVTSGTVVTWEVNDLTTTWADAHYGITQGGDGKTHIITVSGNVVVPPAGLFANTFGTVSDITVIMQGSGAISASGNGNLLRIGNSQTVIVRDLTLHGRDNNSAAVVNAWIGSTFRMEGSARVTGNTVNATDAWAGGVHVTGGTFIMQDEAEISGNTVRGSRAAGGGGVFVGSGSFTMRDNARVENNTASISSSINSAEGGGVYVNNGTFTMEGGSVSGNTANGGNMGNARGGGVFVNISNASFVMYNGTISENTITGTTMAWGGGVFGNFTMHNGTISDNIVSAINTVSSGLVEAHGGGVNGNLTMHGGTISGNTVIGGRTWGNNSDVFAFGGGVHGQLTMHGGTISGNTIHATNDVNANRATANGGGVYSVWNFTKNGGTIYGNYVAENLRNIAVGGRGHAVYFNALGGQNNWRNATAGPNDNSNRLDFWLNEIDITYSVIHNNWPPTSLTFIFSENPGSIQVSDITFCNNVASGNATLSGSGITRTLAPITVNGNGIITTSIFSVYKIYTGFTNVFLIPPAPSGVTAQPSASTITLKWDPLALIDGYRIYRSSSATGAFNHIQTVSATTFVDIRLNRTTSYFYRIIATNAAGESAPAQVSATTLQNNTILAIPVSSSSIVYEWPWDPLSDIVMTIGTLALDESRIPGSLSIRYVIERRASFGSWIEIASIPWPSTSASAWLLFWLGLGNRPGSAGIDHFIVDTRLQGNTLYEYRIWGVVSYRSPLGLFYIELPERAGPFYNASARTLSN